MPKTMAVTIDEEKCTACGACVEVCPVEALKIDSKCKVDADTCIDCGTCVDECPEGAISLE
ncbi:MAG: 4Fe-4S binding protein [Thermoplasmatales archaeon]|nr:4Fe-4S binding protein [Thermoplasmatales archaeon]